MTLRLRPYRMHDEAQAVAIHDAMLPEDFFFLLGWHADMTWAEYLTMLENQRWGLKLTRE
jgi:hypothetical protein